MGGVTRLWLVIALNTVTVHAFSPRALAQPEPPDAKASEEISPLAMKQKMVLDRFQRFEDRVFRLREQLSEIEPENARRLQQVLERAGELGLSEELEAVVRLLDAGSRLNDAMDAQHQWIERADKLLGILLERDSESELRKDELQRLAEYKKSLDRVLTEQRALREATAQAAMNARMLAQIEQTIRRLEAIQQQQKTLADQTQEAQGRGGEQSDAEQAQSGAQQETLADQSAQLGDDLKRMSELQPDEQADSPAQQQARRAAASASGSMGQASQAMKQAASQLNAAQASAASPSQQSAQQALQEARKQLESAKAALEAQVPQPADAAEQRKLSEATEKLADQMRQDAAGGQPGGQQNGQQGGRSGQSSSPGQQTPGLESLDRAQRNMDDASESMQERQHDQAVPRQDKAIAELEQAQKELEKALHQLRHEERAETLRDLEHRFREMLSKQRAINEGTLTLDRVGLEKFTRIERLQTADLADQEANLSRAAATCLHILEEDATTIVFPRIIGQLSTDMATAAARLGELKTGAITQSIQREIVDTLEQLLDAVQQMQQENQRQAGRGSPGRSPQEDEPLLPTSAELKLLKSSQVRVNERTDVIAKVVQQGEETGADVERAFRAVAERQKEAADVAREIRDRERMAP